MSGEGPANRPPVLDEAARYEVSGLVVSEEQGQRSTRWTLADGTGSMHCIQWGDSRRRHCVPLRRGLKMVALGRVDASRSLIVESFRTSALGVCVNG